MIRISNTVLSKEAQFETYSPVKDIACMQIKESTIA